MSDELLQLLLITRVGIILVLSYVFFLQMKIQKTHDGDGLDGMRTRLEILVLATILMSGVTLWAGVVDLRDYIHENNLLYPIASTLEGTFITAILYMIYTRKGE